MGVKGEKRQLRLFLAKANSVRPIDGMLSAGCPGRRGKRVKSILNRRGDNRDNHNCLAYLASGHFLSSSDISRFKLRLIDLNIS